ncbi:MAG: hypothetical protein IE937_01065 [Gammaproteobacteria bacterium]|nr:hypothetical protein [Gammaproteobacteria bacterium]
MMNFQFTQEATIILPVTGNDGMNLKPQTDTIVAELFDSFGGFTMQQANGAWKDPETGREYWEPVSVYHIASVWNEVNIAKLVSIARKAAEWMKQEAIYLSIPSKGVLFVKADEAALGAA